MTTADNTQVRLGYIGLGDMGRGMATNLAKAGFPIKVYDLIPAAMESAIAAGAVEASGLEEVVEFADHIHMCVVYDEQVSQIIAGPNGIIENGRPGQVVIVHSTISPMTIIECSEAAAAKGISVVDSPVSGGGERSMEGTLSIMAGGDDDVVARVRPFLEKCGKVFHVGGVGAGQAMKLTNNVMTHCNRLVYIEALRIAEEFGISESTVNEVVSESTGMSYSQVHHARQDKHIRTHTLAGTDELPYRFGKDLRYAAKVALDRKLFMPMAATGSQVAPKVYAERWQRMLDEDRQF